MLFSTENQEIFDVDEDAKDWFLVSATKKWKEFKATLKDQFFDETITDEELQRKHGDRVKDTDWEFLIEHWTSPEYEVGSKIFIYAYLELCTSLYLLNLTISILGSSENIQS